jgi:hypothetical protein
VVEGQDPFIICDWFDPGDLAPVVSVATHGHRRDGGQLDMTGAPARGSFRAQGMDGRGRLDRQVRSHGGQWIVGPGSRGDGKEDR